MCLGVLLLVAWYVVVWVHSFSVFYGVVCIDFSAVFYECIVGAVRC